MSKQISLKLSDEMTTAARFYAKIKDFDTLQDFIRELLREKFLEEPELLERLSTYMISEEVLAKDWLTEDEAWAHLQK